MGKSIVNPKLKHNRYSRSWPIYKIKILRQIKKNVSNYYHCYKIL